MTTTTMKLLLLPKPMSLLSSADVPNSEKLLAETATMTYGISLDRKSSLRKTVGFILVYFILEVSKQMLNYSLATHHSGQYPIPSPVLQLATEICKLTFVISFAHCLRSPLASQRPSMQFALPAACYLVTNLLYLRALRAVAPPLWMILIQTRTLYTALIYKVVFGHSLQLLQGLGCLLIVLSIPLAKMSDVVYMEKTITIDVIVTSQICALLSTVAAVSVEVLLKNDRRGFSEQQMWLYVWGVAFAVLALPVVETTHDLPRQVLVLTRQDWTSVFGAIVVSALAGLCIPVIVRNLDTIVKDYLGAANNILLSVVTSLLFPSLFAFSLPFLSSLLALLCGVMLYESCSKTVEATSPASERASDIPGIPCPSVSSVKT